VLFAERDGAAARRRIARHAPGAEEAEPTDDIAAAMALIQALLETGRADLGSIRLDMSRCRTFEQRVYALARDIPPGSTSTYGEIAARLGEPGAAQAVGRALGANPFPLVVPCHRVVAAGGKLGGFSAPGGTATKRALLALEQARSGEGPDLFDALR
jgi:methylated-DNA-[protein]-cysteine S-methyltransferase